MKQRGTLINSEFDGTLHSLVVVATTNVFL